VPSVREYVLPAFPYVRSLGNRVRFRQQGDAPKALFLTLLGVVFWAGIFVLFYKVLAYFAGFELFGPVLAQRLLSMVLITFFFLLVFSNMVTALSTFFLSEDMPFWMSAPVTVHRIYTVKYLETLTSSSWMILLFALPVFGAYAAVFGAGPAYFLRLACVLVPFLMIPAALGIALTMILVLVFPARRMKDILFVLGILVFVALFILFRMLRPEQLVDPDAAEGLLGHLVTLRAPSNVFLPPHWAAEALAPFLFPGSGADGSFFLLLLVTSGAAAVVLGGWLGEGVLMHAWSRAQESGRGGAARLRVVDRMLWNLPAPVSGPWRALMIKEIKAFFRDTTQWSQLLLLLALVVVYVYNFSVLPLERYPLPAFHLQHVVAFVNLALAAFVLAAVAVRFVYPSVSLEGRAFWILRTAPVSVRSLLWSKFWLGLVPLLVLSEILVGVTNHFLGVSRFMMLYSLVMVFLLTVGITAMGVGFGALYPRFTVENPAKVSTGFGGMVFMMVSILYVGAVVALSARPAYVYLRAQVEGAPLPAGFWAQTALVVLAIGLLQGAGTLLPMHAGARRLDRREV
jgi:ABC-2 type transport system permease protein